MISAYQEQGLKYISELSVEEQASQEEYEKEVNKAKNKSVGKEKAVLQRHLFRLLRMKNMKLLMQMKLMALDLPQLKSVHSQNQK
jgi:hypothetical protein